MRTLLQHSIERLLADAVTPDLLRAAEGGAWPTDLWAKIEELGLPLAAVPEDLGGAGASWTDIFVVIRACGAAAAPTPLPEAILANSLLAAAGLESPESGPIVFAAGLADAPLAAVPWGRHARWLALHDTQAGQIALHSLARARIVPDNNVAGEPRDTVTLAAGSLVAGAATSAATDAVMLGGAMLRSAQMAGALGRLTEISADYANERVQFGRPIGKFQAVQQQLAVLATQAAAAVSASEAAFLMATPCADLVTTASAKAVSGEAAGKGAGIAHAVFGAIGFTHEHSLHFLTRRLWAWRGEYGSDAFWADRLGRTLAARGGDGLWPLVTAALCGDQDR
ncbi:MAG: acyl-CoA dehydrogenase domain protein [Caulobacter sp.]|nr:acyl-CoA dehydrogenase domain protein [Caulobacter sp.]